MEPGEDVIAEPNRTETHLFGEYSGIHERL